MKIKSDFLLFLAFSATLWACKTQTIVQEKITDTPEKFRTTQIVHTDSSIADISWQDFFQDPVLQELIDTALLHNVDMQLALKNIEATQLLFRQARLAHLPTVQLQVQANTTNPSNNSLNGLSLGQFLGQNHIEDYTAALGLSWEADIWGKIRNQKAAALATYLQTEEARKMVQTTLVSQIAKGYYQLLMLYQLQAIALKNLQLSDSTLYTVQHQYEVGDISLLGLEQVAAQRQSAAALIPDFEQQILLQENALRVLTGQFPDSIRTSITLSDIRLPSAMQVGVPASLLQKRPDVRRAELAVTVTQANQSIARAQLYPSLSITAQAGVNAFKTSNWFNIPASLFGAVAGSITQPILQRGELKTQHELSRVEREKAVIQFRQSVIAAVGEVSDALITIQKLKERQHILLNKTERLKGAVQHADLLYETGVANYLEVITAQSNALQSELELVQTRKAQLVAVVDLYRSLGGGWSN